MYGAIEAGGTKFVLAVIDKHFEIIKRISFPTTSPKEVMSKIKFFFESYQLESLGVGSFGPIGINRESETFGFITNTPKLKWKNFNFLGELKKIFNIPISWTTDVNAAAYGEVRFGAGRHVDSCIYLTVGTGIGGGLIINNQIIQGYQHPELGHIIVRRHPDDINFEGTCPYHEDCLEGLAAGPAIQARWGKPAFELYDNNQVWDLEAYYLAQAIYNYYSITSVSLFILGGGVMKHPKIIEKVRNHIDLFNQGYLSIPSLESFIVSPQLGDNAAIMGCASMAMEILENYS